MATAIKCWQRDNVLCHFFAFHYVNLFLISIGFLVALVSHIVHTHTAMAITIGNLIKLKLNHISLSLWGHTTTYQRLNAYSSFYCK